eukprot:gene15705-21814_t
MVLFKGTNKEIILTDIDVFVGLDNTVFEVLLGIPFLTHPNANTNVDIIDACLEIRPGKALQPIYNGPALTPNQLESIPQHVNTSIMWKMPLSNVKESKDNAVLPTTVMVLTADRIARQRGANTTALAPTTQAPPRETPNHVYLYTMYGNDRVDSNMWLHRRSVFQALTMTQQRFSEEHQRAQQVSTEQRRGATRRAEEQQRRGREDRRASEASEARGDKSRRDFIATINALFNESAEDGFTVESDICHHIALAKSAIGAS